MESKTSDFNISEVGTYRIEIIVTWNHFTQMTAIPTQRTLGTIILLTFR